MFSLGMVVSLLAEKEDTTSENMGSFLPTQGVEINVMQVEEVLRHVFSL